MRTPFRHFGLVLTVLLIFFLIDACSTENDPVPEPDMPEGATCTLNGGFSIYKDLECNKTITRDFYANQTLNIGVVNVSYDGQNVVVDFVTTGGWKMTETHLYVGDCALMPFTSTCEPDYGQFPHVDYHSTPVDMHKYVIPASNLDQCFCFLAAATVQSIQNGTVVATETAIVAGDNQLPGNQWGWYSVFCTETCTTTTNTSCDIKPGEFRTQTQGGWGSKPNGNNPGAYLHANFASAFPAGLTFGCNYTLSFTSAQAVTDFLPNGGGPKALDASLIDPDKKGTSTLAGNLTALMISLGMDAYDPNFGASSTLLKDLVVAQGDFAGWTVQQVAAEASQGLGGCSTSYSLSQLNDVVTSINENFVDGTMDNGFLKCP